MENEKTARPRRWKLLAAINLCLVILCGATFGANALTARADTAAEKTSAAEQWYEIDEEGEVLSIYLHNHVSGYDWRYGLSNDKLRQLHGHEIKEDDLDEEKSEAWRLYLVPRDEDGDVEITFVCVKDSESDSIDTRTLKIRVKEGKLQLLGE